MLPPHGVWVTEATGGAARGKLRSTSGRSRTREPFEFGRIGYVRLRIESQNPIGGWDSPLWSKRRQHAISLGGHSSEYCSKLPPWYGLREQWAVSGFFTKPSPRQPSVAFIADFCCRLLIRLAISHRGIPNPRMTTRPPNMSLIRPRRTTEFRTRTISRRRGLTLNLSRSTHHPRALVPDR